MRQPIGRPPSGGLLDWPGESIDSGGLTRPDSRKRQQTQQYRGLMPTSISLAVIDGRVFLIDADNHVGVCGVPSFATHHAAEIFLNSEGFANDPATDEFIRS